VLEFFYDVTSIDVNFIATKDLNVIPTNI